MAVQHNAFSDPGGEMSGNQSWTHTPSGTAKGVLVFLLDSSSSSNPFTGLTYDGVSVPGVVGATAADTSGEPGYCKAYFLAGTFSGAKTVAVTTSSTTWIGFCITVDSSTGASLEVNDVVVLQEDGTLAEQNVTDGASATNSVRYAAGFSGLISPPSVGANTTLLISYDLGPRGYVVARETTAGQGSRPVGFSSGSSDDRAFVHLAVREVVASGSGPGRLINGGLMEPKLITGRLAA